MAQGGEFGHDNPDLDYNIDNDDDDYDDQKANTTQEFRPGAASTPYHGGEQHGMQTMHEKSGLPSYDEKTPLIDPNEDIERRLRNLRENNMTGIIETTKIPGNIENPLSQEDKEEQIRRVKTLIKQRFPNAKVDGLVIDYSKKNPMDIVVYGPRGGETKIVLDDGSDLQKSFLKATFVKRILGPPAEDIKQKSSAHIVKKQEERKKLNGSQPSEQILRNDKETRTLNERMNREQAIIAQLKDDPESDKAEIKKKEQLVENLKEELKTKQKERVDLKKKLEKIGQLDSSISEEERERNAMEEGLNSTKTFDALKEQEIHLLRLNEEDQAIIQDELEPSFNKEAAEERVAARNEEIARVQTYIAEREANMPLRERVSEIFKKYGVTAASIFIAAGVTIGAVIGALTNALKAMGKQLANGLKAVGAKAASALPGLIGAVVSFLFKTAGQAIGYLAEHTWLLILAVVVFLFQKLMKKR